MSDDLDRTITWAELVTQAGARLSAAGLVDVERHARLIAQQVCGAGPSEWFSLADQPATVRGVAAMDAMTARRVAGEPLQYVLGEWSFRHLDLYIDHRVLIPRPETEVVAGVALAEVERLAPKGVAATAVDLGTGSGAIGLSLVTEHEGVEVWLTDASADALAVARANLAGLGRGGSRIRVAHGSWFDALPDGLRGLVDVVVSNPPYVADAEDLPDDVVSWEPAGALFAGPTGHEHLDLLVSEAPRWLSPVGSLVLELAPHQAAAVAESAATRFAEVEIIADLAGRERAVVARVPNPIGPVASGG